MKVILGTRQVGKTTQLARMVKEDPKGILIVHNYTDKGRVIKLYDLPENKVSTYVDFKSSKIEGANPANIYIDNAEWLLKGLCGRHDLKGVAFGIESADDINKNN